MRDIKFRAWNNIKKYMKDFTNTKDGIEYSDGSMYVSSGYDGYDRPTYEEPSEYTIMQYTGLKDVDDVEIYEGDVLWDGEEYHDEVVFEDGRYLLLPSCEDLRECYKSLQIVGNIYANPELKESLKL